MTAHSKQRLSHESTQRLSDESMDGVSRMIQGFSEMNVRNSANGVQNGEMRIRLRPDHLGELHVKVAMKGRSVELQIHASDDNAMKVLQESLGSLKESLAGHSLTLGKVDLLMNSGNPSELASRSQQDFTGSSQQQFASNENAGLNWGGSSQQRQQQWNERGAETGEVGVGGLPRASRSAAGIAGMRSGNGSGLGRASSSGRIDVMA